MIRRFLAAQADRILNWLASPIELGDVLGPNDLADIEAQLDSYEPDDLWGCHQRFLATPCCEGSPLHGENSTTSPPFGVVRPADAASATECVGGPSKTDDQLIEELVSDYRDFLRDCFKRG